MSTHDQYCRECGTPISAGAEKCPKCGHQISQATRSGAKSSIDVSRARQTQSATFGDMISRGDDQPGKYQIADGFILNTKTGDVWKYDENSGKLKVVEKEDSLLTSAEKAKTYLALSEDFAQLANLDLQTQQDRRQKILQTLSNVSKKMHDTAEGIVRNIK
ncbi:MAG: zinc ribbon domain-containing protein [Candidatus Hermodarchaeota archaeon]